MPFALQYFRTRHVTKNSSMDVAITSKVLIDKPTRMYIYCHISLKTLLKNVDHTEFPHHLKQMNTVTFGKMSKYLSHLH